MKKITYLLLIFGCPLFVQSQPGIQFTHSLSWPQIVAKAKKEKKFIFVDAFMTWCGPCKMMAREVFPQQKVGDFYNTHFINVVMQLDSTAADNAEVKSRYSDAHDLQAKYKVNVFPTYLFFDPSGKLVHKKVGSSSAEDFIVSGNESLRPETQYYRLKDKYLAGQRDTAFMRRLALAAAAAFDGDFSYKVANEYLLTQKNWLSHDDLSLVYSSTRKTSDTGFNFMLNHADTMDGVLGKGQTLSYLRYMILQQDILPVLDSSGKWKSNVNWQSLETSLQRRYPTLGKKTLLMAKASYDRDRQDWPSFRETVNQYVLIDTNNVDPVELNDFAWTVFTNCNDRQCLESALEWSKRSLSGANAKESMYMDTYANILYKLGHKEEAIGVEKEAVTIRNQPGGDLEKTLEKMQKGEPTW